MPMLNERIEEFERNEERREHEVKKLSERLYVIEEQRRKDRWKFFGFGTAAGAGLTFIGMSLLSDPYEDDHYYQDVEVIED